MLSWILRKGVLANNQVTTNINEDKIVEYAKLNKTRLGKKSHRLTKSANN